MADDIPERRDSESVFGYVATCFQVGKAKARVSDAMQKKRIVGRMMVRGDWVTGIRWM